MKDVAIVGYCRTGIARAARGALNQTHGIPMAAHVLLNAVERARIEPAEVEDVVLGCGFPEGATGHNIARTARSRPSASRCPVSLSTGSAAQVSPLRRSLPIALRSAK